jgi:hypothetical protein
LEATKFDLKVKNLNCMDEIWISILINNIVK